MNPKLFLLTLVVFLFSIPATAQEWTDTLKGIEIISDKEKLVQNDFKDEFSKSQQREYVDSSIKVFYDTESLSKLITEQSAVFVKSYGVNGMATLNFRGASAAQSAVLWNGIPITNPALGMADISLLQAGLFENIALQYGSSSALYGSGNVGGALILEHSKPEFKKQQNFKLNLGLGSFGKKDVAGNLHLENKRWRIKWNSFYQNQKNNFSYQDEQGEINKMDNAQLKGWGSILSADLNLDKNNAIQSNHSIALHAWYQEYYREIPPALFEAFSVKNQKDRSIRLMTHWQKKQDRSSFYAKAAYNLDYLNYKDGVVLPDNDNQFAQIYTEIGWKYRIDNPLNHKDFLYHHQFLFFIPAQWDQVVTQNRSEHTAQQKIALAMAYQAKTFYNRLDINVSMRQEWIRNQHSELLPGMGLHYLLMEKKSKRTSFSTEIFGNIQKTFRSPTLNELYFSPGGNEQLKPEKGWSQDIGFGFKWKTNEGNVTIQQDLSMFNRNIEDWIYWLGGTIWTPHNLAKVHSRGLETNHRTNWHIADWQLKLGFKTAYVLATTTSSYLPGDGSIGKQIPYSPRYNGQLNLGIKRKNIFLNYNFIYTGYRFVTVDESLYLNPYQVNNLQLSYVFNWKNWRTNINVQMVNMGNASYQIVNGRPMPGRHFLMNMQIELGTGS